jgi:Tol biopolymer transport system component
MAQRFDPDRGLTTADPIPVARNVDFNPTYSVGAFSASQTGILAYYSGGAALNSRLTFLDMAGQPGDFRQLSISPDGKTLAVDCSDPKIGAPDIWLYDLERGTASRFTSSRTAEMNPTWSPGGERIVYYASSNGLIQKSIGGTSAEELLLKSDRVMHPSDWSHDGRFIIYPRIDPKTKDDIWLLPLIGDRKPLPFLQTEFNETQAKLSPGDRWLAYTSDETGRDEVYVQSFPAPGAKSRISTNGGNRPIWSRDGKYLYYIAADRKLTQVAVTTSPKFHAGAPKPLFETRLGPEHAFDIHPDGRRFIMPIPLEDATATPMTVVINWPEALKISSHE